MHLGQTQDRYEAVVCKLADELTRMLGFKAKVLTHRVHTLEHNDTSKFVLISVE